MSTLERSLERLFAFESCHKDFVMEIAVKARSRQFRRVLDEELVLCCTWQKRLELLASLLKDKIRVSKLRGNDRLNEQFKEICKRQLSPAMADLALIILMLRAEQQRIGLYQAVQKQAMQDKRLAEAFLVEKTVHEIGEAQSKFRNVAATEKSVAGLWKRFLLKKEHHEFSEPSYH